MMLSASMMTKASKVVEDAVEGVVEDPALALAGEVIAVPDDGAGALGLAMGVVGAGVADDEAVHEVARVVLGQDGAHQVADDRLLVMRRDDEAIAVVLLGHRELDRTAPDDAEDVDKLVEVGKREKQPDD